MPRFHFHSDGQRDVDGTEVANLQEAKCEAIRMAGRIICEEAAEFWDSAEWTMTVTDDRGLTQFQLQIIGTEAPSIRSSSSVRRASS